MSLKWSNIIWEEQMRALVSLPENCGTNPGWYDWRWSAENPDPVLLSVYLPMDHYLFPFVLHVIPLSVTNMHDAQIGTSSFKYGNIYGRTPSFASLNMDLGWRSDNLSCQSFNDCCKGDSTCGNMIFLFFLVWYSLLRLYIPLRKLELIQYLAHFLTWGTP